MDLAEGTVKDLCELRESGVFPEVTDEAMEIVAGCVRDEGVLEALSRDVGLVHDDLSSDNVFVVDGGYVVIDWQMPILGPRSLNRPPKFVSDGGVDVAGMRGDGTELMHLYVDAEAAGEVVALGDDSGWEMYTTIGDATFMKMRQ